MRVKALQQDLVCAFFPHLAACPRLDVCQPHLVSLTTSPHTFLEDHLGCRVERLDQTKPFSPLDGLLASDFRWSPSQANLNMLKLT